MWCRLSTSRDGGTDKVTCAASRRPPIVEIVTIKGFLGSGVQKNTAMNTRGIISVLSKKGLTRY